MPWDWFALLGVLAITPYSTLFLMLNTKRSLTDGNALNANKQYNRMFIDLLHSYIGVGLLKSIRYTICSSKFIEKNDGKNGSGSSHFSEA
ncbi:putative uncharacterized protein [Vibrio anguillarum]|nr:putative uncharacterized protein [Vibrio anguillarum]